MNKFMQLCLLTLPSFLLGMLLSEPLCRAFGDVIAEPMVKIFMTLKYSVKRRIQNLRIGIVRVLIGEVFQLNIISAIAKAQHMDRWNSGITVDELFSMIELTRGEPVNQTIQASAVKTAFNVCDTVLFEEIIAKVPRAQERILLAFDQIEGRAPYDSIRNEAYRKFIRE